MPNTTEPKSNLVRHNGALTTIGEIPPGELAAALSAQQRAGLAAKLGGIRPSRSKLQIVADAVANDPECHGKAGLALAMLADDDYAAISGAGIVKMLRRAPGATAQVTDPEAAQRAGMRAALALSSNSRIEPNGGSGARADDAAATWDRAIASATPKN